MGRNSVAGALVMSGYVMKERKSSEDHSRVNNTGTTTSNHGPHSTFSVKDGKLKRCTSRGIKLGNVGFLFGQVSAESN